MEWSAVIEKELSFARLQVCAGFAGEDVLLWIGGGDRQHLGSVVQAVPRFSLTGDGSTSCTSSVLNLTGHKDEAICRALAEKICTELRAVTVCTGGFHVDNIEPEQIREVMKAAEDVGDEVVLQLKISKRM